MKVSLNRKCLCDEKHNSIDDRSDTQPTDILPTVQIAPNPVEDLLDVQLENWQEPVYYQVNSIEGKQLKFGIFESAQSVKNQKIDCSLLPKGLFLLTFRDATGYSITHKIIKQ